MHIKSLHLKNFRRFEEISFSFSPHRTLIIGPNAIGKTTILEALYILLFGRSFRALTLHETIREGESHAAIEAHFFKEGIEHTLGFYYSETERKVRFNRSDYRSLSSLVGLLLGQALLPSDIHLITGPPQGRRQLLDYVIAQIDPFYTHHLGRYNTVLKNRNALLKNRDFNMIDFFEDEMAKSASYISTKRHQIVNELDRLAREQLALFGTSLEFLSMKYLPHGAPTFSKEDFLKFFQKNRAKEAHLGFTLGGPQKDDIAFFLSGKECKLFSSEGQKRSVAAAIRLASWDHLKNSASLMPFLLVDDVGLGFDQKRKNSFFESLLNRGQVLITSSDEDFKSDFMDIISLRA